MSEEPAEHWVALCGGRPVGWIQCYAWADYEDEEETRVHWAAGVDRTAAGIDYLIGETTDRGRGIGAEFVRIFVHDIVFPLHPHWTQVSASPFVANEASWRALLHAGFRALADHDAGDDDGPCRIMVVDRPEGR